MSDLGTGTGGASPAPTVVRTCRVCGCTDERACAGGCRWVEADLCSRCEGLQRLTRELADATMDLSELEELAEDKSHPDYVVAGLGLPAAQHTRKLAGNRCVLYDILDHPIIARRIADVVQGVWLDEAGELDGDEGEADEVSAAERASLVRAGAAGVVAHGVRPGGGRR